MQHLYGRLVAFFDIDGTIFRSSLLIELVKYLILIGVFPAEATTKYETAYKRWRNREGTYADYIDQIIKIFDALIVGKKLSDLIVWCKEMIVDQQKETYCFTRDLIRELKRSGYDLVAISHSPKPAVDAFVAYYEFDYAYGRKLCVNPQNGLIEPGVEHEELIMNKGSVVNHFYEKYGFDLGKSIGVGDSNGDVSLFEKTAKQLCFNPNQPLRQLADKKNWLIGVERKDVNYFIRGNQVLSKDEVYDYLGLPL